MRVALLAGDLCHEQARRSLPVFCMVREVAICAVTPCRADRHRVTVVRPKAKPRVHLIGVKRAGEVDYGRKQSDHVVANECRVGLVCSVTHDGRRVEFRNRIAAPADNESYVSFSW
jgi:hypothetical protein